ncbi:MAG: ABC transporter ATP-binding protein [Chloroflexota bacterium]|nr:ABC transporter ATP-binding protein [Chloroflexota bacterium]
MLSISGTNTGRGQAISCQRVDVHFGAFQALADITLDIHAGEFVCLLGPSGCGKSTLLNALAGFVTPTSGFVEAGGRRVAGPAASRGMVFQSTEALFPWLTVSENVAFGPRMRGVPRREREPLVRGYIQLVGLDHAAHRFPPALSGGMRQRAQIARVLANEPPVVLMDEPFGSLDAQTREILQGELIRIWAATAPTVVFVTHDVLEAITLADRIVTMTSGPSARIKAMYEVLEKRPRDIGNSRVLELYQQIRGDIADEVRRVTQAELA